ncbi:hypothetical protein [Mucilaginibacter paludis]|uniref:hypothetical protein n=1 Tax=Mucilaginibacter paludis TaxID=423351 RepID=UPI00058AD0FB|nr:hypothetical protein [Mucilaginibacter paludis]
MVLITIVLPGKHLKGLTIQAPGIKIKAAAPNWSPAPLLTILKIKLKLKPMLYLPALFVAFG